MGTSAQRKTSVGKSNIGFSKAINNMGENTVQEVMLDLQSGNIHYYVSYLKDIVDEECDLSVRTDVLMENVL